MQSCTPIAASEVDVAPLFAQNRVCVSSIVRKFVSEGLYWPSTSLAPASTRVLNRMPSPPLFPDLVVIWMTPFAAREP